MGLSDEQLRSSAADLLQAEVHRKVIVQPSKTFPGMDLEDAYAIQRIGAQLRIDAGATVVGHKIGLTSRAMQMASQITEPDYGYLLDTMVFDDGAQIPAENFLLPRLEVELAFVMGEELRGPGVHVHDVLRATEFLTPALEIIDYRTEVPRAITDTIADNAAAAAMVVGGRVVRPMDIDARWVGATLAKNGIIEESGMSAAVMGHPAVGVAWLANKLAPLGGSLQRGQIVLAGSFTRPVSVAAGDVIYVDYGDLGLDRRRVHLMAEPVPLPPNLFKRAIADHRRQLGLWCSLASAYAAEVVAGSGFDWLLLDTEHSPNDVQSVLGELQAVASYPVSAVVRPAINDSVLIKQYLDIGAQSLLLPYIESAEEARAAVASTRYPPEGIRGVAALTRASRFGRIADYGRSASSEVCLLVQVETRRALDRLEEIAAVDGVDGVFIGPSDLAASLGHIGEPGHDEVVAAVEGAIRRVADVGKPSGVLTSNPGLAKRYLDLGATFVAVGVDLDLLARGSEQMLAGFQ